MRYDIYSESISDGQAQYTAYGIVLPNGERVSDVTPDLREAKLLVRLLNENKIEPEHALDVIEDFLAERTTLEIKHLE